MKEVIMAKVSKTLHFKEIFRIFAIFSPVSGNYSFTVKFLEVSYLKKFAIYSLASQNFLSLIKL